MTDYVENFSRTKLSGVWIHHPKSFPDARGTTLEIFNPHRLPPELKGLEISQILESRSSLGVIRGIHYSSSTNPQVKIVRCIQGEIRDCVIDLRPESSTFGVYEVFDLDSKASSSLIISPGFGHAYQVLSADAIVLYALQTSFNFFQEYSIYPLDKDLSLPWANIPTVLSNRDLIAPRYNETLQNRFFQ
jgi:dTDP-4-dehydrorhamnose 3,5-epimerase